MRKSKYFFSVFKVICFVFVGVFLFLECMVFMYVNNGFPSAFYQKNKKAAYTAYFIGESTMCGAPYHRFFSLSDLICYQYGGILADKTTRIVNLGAGGSNIEFQFQRFFWEIFFRPPRNGILIVYSGINDFCYEGTEDKGFYFWSLLQHSFLFSRILDICMQKGLFTFVFGDYYSAEKYEYRLRKLIKYAKKNNLQIVISTLVGNYAGFPADSLRLSDFVDFDSAVQPGALFDKAEEYKKQKNYAFARKYYYAAVNYKGSLRPTLLQNQIIRRIANEEKIHLVDMFAFFEQHSRSGLLDDSLFIDAHHPNLNGYGFMSKAFSMTLERVYGGRPAVQGILRYDDFCSKFNLEFSALSDVYLSMAYWHAVIASNYLNRASKLRILYKARYYLEQSLAFSKRESKYTDKVLAAYVLIAAVEGNQDAVNAWMERGALNKNKLLHTNRYYNKWIQDTIKRNRIYF